MSFDGMVAAAIGRELQNKIIGARVEKIYQPVREQVILTLHTVDGKCTLLLSAQAESARIHLTQHKTTNPLMPPTFCMVLRKHLEGGRVTSVRQDGLERVITIEVESLDDYGRPTIKKLITEIMGRHSNVILVDAASGLILDGIRRYTHAVSRYREVLPGRAYLAPPAPSKANPLEINEQSFQDIIINEPENNILTADKLLVKLFHGLSPLAAREILYRAGFESKTHVHNWGEYEFSKLWQAWLEIFQAIKKGVFTPTLVYGHDRDPVAFAAIDLRSYEGMERRHLSISEALDIYFTRKAQKAVAHEKYQRLARIINQARENIIKKIALQEEALAEAAEGATWRIWGDILMANLYTISPGAKEAILPNIFEPEAPEINIPLNPALSPSQNAQRYYKRYSRARNTTVKASAIKDSLAEELAYLESILTHLDLAKSPDEMVEIEEELAAAGYLKKKAAKGTKQKQAVPEPLRVTSADGYTILVGRNNRQNDYLTMKLANPDDLWLHAKDMPGSHVVIKDPGPEIPDDALIEAASLAAYYSKGRNSGKVAVDYTWRHNVWKPRGSKPGFVLYDNYWTVLVDAQNDVVKNLLLP